MPTTLRLLNDWQHDFPLCRDPFGVLATHTGLCREAVLDTLRQALLDGRLSRIGGVFAPGSGGDAMLVAMAVPAQRIETVAQRVSAHPGVNHNYLREHTYNLWFVMTGPDRNAVEAGVTELEQACALPALRLRMLRPYRIDLGFDLGGNTANQTMRVAVEPPVAPLSAQHWPLACRVEAGLPLVAHPFAQWADELGCPEDTVTQDISQWLKQGLLKRFGVVVRHHELGYCANAMTVFDVPDHQVDACGQALAAQTGVTLAYCRVRAPDWPFNLYAMVHGTERAAVLAVIERATHAAGLQPYARQVLFSTRRFKQTGARRFRGWERSPQAPAHAPLLQEPHALS